MWKQLDIDKVNSEAKRLRDELGPDVNGVGGIYDTCRVYGWNGEMWPRIVLSTCSNAHSGRSETGLYVSFSRKNSPEEWWEKMVLPRELIPDLIELLTEAKEIPPPTYTEEEIDGVITYKQNGV